MTFDLLIFYANEIQQSTLCIRTQSYSSLTNLLNMLSNSDSEIFGISFISLFATIDAYLRVYAF